jgi:hypothetical protein
MPLLVNSALGFLFKIEDDKPEKVCQWTECPNTKSGYKDSKMPMCARCKLVRYCVRVRLYLSTSTTLDIALIFTSLRNASGEIGVITRNTAILRPYWTLEHGWR